MTQRDDHEKTIRQSAGERARVLPILQDYLARTGLTVSDFAHRINYAPQTLGLFANDKYHHVAGTHRLLCEAIERYIVENPLRAPQQLMGELYETENVRIIRSTIDKLLKHPVGYLIYGPPGSQKSFTLEHEIARLNSQELGKNGHGRRAYYVYAMKGMRPTQLIKEIAIACGSSSVGDAPRVHRNLAWDFRGRRVLVAIDEAQNLGANDKDWVACLEMVRVLLDRAPYFSLLLAGMHTLLSKFNRYSATLGQWNDRIAGKKMLPGLSEEEAQAIAQREMPGLSEKRMTAFIKGATREDAYNDDTRYINIRSLTASLREARMLRGQ
jgi:hypothetical protein